jgi:hypothetical protein
MPFDVILAGALGVSILLFALAGGADFGAGLWSNNPDAHGHGGKIVKTRKRGRAVLATPSAAQRFESARRLSRLLSPALSFAIQCHLIPVFGIRVKHWASTSAFASSF